MASFNYHIKHDNLKCHDKDTKECKIPVLCEILAQMFKFPSSNDVKSANSLTI